MQSPSDCRVVIIDNFDSFTYNIVQLLGAIGVVDITVLLNTVSLEELIARQPTHLIISPGPCGPESTGVVREAIGHFAGHIPILGICLGHQTIGYCYGATVGRAPRVMHGKQSAVTHTDHPLFASVVSPFPAGRYHSLVIKDEALPDAVEVIARSNDDGVIMAITHRTIPGIYGVQFHPESILTTTPRMDPYEHGSPGRTILANFLALSLARSQ
jgi:anthranilate synthase component 2